MSVGCLGLSNAFDQLGGRTQALGCDDPEFGAVASDGVDQPGPLTDQQLARSVKQWPKQRSGLG